MKTRVLMLNRKIKFAAAIKEALESTGLFEVHPFTSVEAAVDYLLGNPQDIALVDFNLTGMTGRDAVLQLRAVQAELPVIISPKQSEPAVRGLRFQGMVDMPFNARDIITLINNIVEQSQHLVAGANTLPIQPPPPDDIPESGGFSSLDSILAESGGVDVFEDSKSDTLPLIIPAKESESLWDARAKDKLPEETRAELDAESQTALTIFERLAREEPPLPGLEENGTVGDLIGDTAFRAVMAILRGDDMFGEVTLKVETLSADAGAPADADFADIDVDLIVADAGKEVETALPSPAQKILETALDDSTPLKVSLQELIANIERQYPDQALDMQPPTTWVEDGEAADVYPPAPPEDLPEGYTGQFADKTTQPSGVQPFEPHPERLDTEADVQSVPPLPETLPEALPPVSEAPTMTTPTAPFVYEGIESLMTEADSVAQESAALLPDFNLDSALFDSTFDRLATFEVKQVEITPPADPYLARLALSLTQVSLELAAEATLLTSDGQIVAHAGRLTQEEIDELSEAIQDDWQAPLEDARLRFVSVEGSGKDYMLYSKRTDDDYTLSMIFGATTPLRDIRKQGKRLLEALKAVPEPTPVETDGGVVQEIEFWGESQPLKPLPRPAEAIPTTVYAFVWLIRDPNARLSDQVGAAIVTGLTTQLTEKGWKIQVLQAQEDYVYLLAEVPGDTLAQELVRDLKTRAAEIARMQDPSLDANLWADSYFILTPGRAIDVEEIQQFINFDRAM